MEVVAQPAAQAVAERPVADGPWTHDELNTLLAPLSADEPKPSGHQGPDRAECGRGQSISSGADSGISNNGWRISSTWMPSGSLK